METALAADTAAAQQPDRLDLREAREKAEVGFIVEVLRHEGGNVTRAAQALRLSRVMLQRKMMISAAMNSPPCRELVA